MTPEEIQQMLQEGIDAVQRGQKKRGQDLLLRAVAADEFNEQGWLWLSAAVEDAQDKITALENVLAINPDNSAAQANLKWLRSRAAGLPGDAAGPNADAASLAPFAPYSPIDPIEAIDDPYQCVYCGAPAAPEDRRCPECGRSLMTKRAKSKSLSGTLRSAALALIVMTALAAVEFIVLMVIFYQGRNIIVSYTYETLRLQDFFGYYLDWPVSWVPVLVGAGLFRAALLAALILGLLQRITLAYYCSVASMVLDIVWSVFRWASSFIGPILGAADIVAAVAVLAVVFAADRDFEVNAERMTCQPDRRLKGGVALNRRGHVYRQRGKWALAVAHWRAAVGAMPEQPEFYKDLAVGCAQIGYYARALRAVEEAGRQAPDDADIPLMKTLIEEKRAADPRPRG